LPTATAVQQCSNKSFAERLAEFFTDVVSMIEGRGSSRLIRGELVAGKLEQVSPATIVGGTPSVLVSLIGTPYAPSIFRKGRWLALEDVNEAPHRLDRMLAHLELAGILDRCAGLLLGDFHEGENDRTDQVLASLAHILPKRPATPIVVTKDFGHTWPMAPLPIGRPVELHRYNRQVELVVPWGALGTA
jgi:muramoyltetrapeptide carboxypeptidase LdcA involved in peptidoglycan recycling